MKEEYLIDETLLDFADSVFGQYERAGLDCYQKKIGAEAFRRMQPQAEVREKSGKFYVIIRGKNGVLVTYQIRMGFALVPMPYTPRAFHKRGRRDE